MKYRSIIQTIALQWVCEIPVRLFHEIGPTNIKGLDGCSQILKSFKSH